MRHRRYLLLVALSVGAAAQAGPKDPPLVPPPMAQPQTISIFRGKSVLIPLRTQGRAPGHLKFLIRSLPAKGRLGEIRLTGPKSAEITYTHDNGSGGSDSFTFAVQASDSPVSAAATIAISISEEAPALTVVKSVDFGTLEVGASREEQVVLQNSGGGVLEGSLDVSPPWKIVGSTEYRLGRHQQSRVRLLCAPVEPQDYSGRLLFSHDAQAAVELTATAVAPFDFDPSREIELSSQAASSVRSGGTVIRNRTARDRILKISAPPEIVSPDQVFVPAGGEEKLALHVRPGFLAELDGVVRFESEGFKHDIPLRVYALPPVLRIEPREGLDFGQIAPRSQQEGFLRIKNEGGSPARLRARTPREILLAPDPNWAVLQPGETRIFHVAFEVSSLGEYRSEIIIESGSGKMVSVPVTAQVSPQAGEAQKVPTAALDSAARPAANAPGPSQTVNSIAAVKEIKTLKAGNRIFEIGWKKPASEPVAWIIQQRHLEVIDAGPPKAVWKDLHNVKFFEQDDTIGARFENLAPGQVWFLRVVALDQQGRRSPPSPTFMISTAPAKDQRLLRGTFLLLALGAGVVLIVKRRQRKQAEVSAQAEQIARIKRG